MLMKRLAPFQPRGEHNPRHFDKLVWRLPIPIYENSTGAHRTLVDLAERAEKVAAAVDVTQKATFQAHRRRIREVLDADGVTGEIDRIVAELIV
jgi:hypothetical protein